MRNVLLAFASLAALSSVASADVAEPSAPDSTPSASTTGEVDVAPSVTASGDVNVPPTTYLSGGAMLGGNDGNVTLGGNVEVGKQVSSLAWVHGSFMLGSASQLLAHGDGSIMQGRVGADLMSCGGGKGVCAFVGADIGVQAVNYDGMSDPLFCGPYSSNCNGDPISQHSTALLGVGRVGLDIGGEHVRWRPGIEASATTDGGVGVNLTQSIAYRF